MTDLRRIRREAQQAIDEIKTARTRTSWPRQHTETERDLYVAEIIRILQETKGR